MGLGCIPPLSHTVAPCSQFHLLYSSVKQVTENSAPAEATETKVLWMFAPALVVEIAWLVYMVHFGSFGLFNGFVDGNPRWYMSVTMLFGSILAGATSEGGGAVAFPVMTLAFGIAATTARDFSLMIQSVGMSCATFNIVRMRVLVEWRAIRLASLGGAVGVVVGLEFIELSAPYAKLYFVTIWSSFALALYALNTDGNRKVYPLLDLPGTPAVYRGDDRVMNWKGAVLVATGVVGGIFTSVAGSGIDICSFCVLTLLFRLSEKTATPTSVILMSINTVVGFAWRELRGGVDKDAWGFFFVCVPIVCVGAPIGSLISSYAHRLTLASTVYVLSAVQVQCGRLN